MAKEPITAKVKYPIGDTLPHPHKIEELAMNQGDYIAILDRIEAIFAQRDSIVAQLGISMEEWDAYLNHIHEPALWEAQ